MRVLHLTRDFPPRATGGLSTAVGGLVGASRAEGVEASVLSFDGYRPSAGGASAPPVCARQADVPVMRIATSDQLDAARAFARDQQPSLVHVHDALLWRLAAELCESLDARTAYTVHVAQAHQSRLRGLETPTQSERAEHDALAEADAVLAPSRAVKALLEAAQPALAPRLWLAPLGTADAPAGDERDAETVAYVGRFADINGAAELIEVAISVLAEVPGARVVVAGGLPENQRAQRRWEERWLAALPPVQADRFDLRGWLPPAEVGALLAKAGVLVVPSWFETFGQVALEGMVRGAAVVASDAGGLAELIEHDRNGVLTPPRDVAAMTAEVCALLGDRRRAERLGLAARRDARRRWLWPDVVWETLRVYRKLGPAKTSRLR